MKHALVFIAVVVAFASPVFSQSKSKEQTRNAKVEQELKTLVRMWDNAMVARDAATLDRLLADEWSFVGGMDKQRYLALVKSSMGFESAVSTNFNVRVYGNTTALSAVDTIKKKANGRESINKYLYLDVWIKRDGRWQCVSTHSTPFKEGEQ